MGAPAGWWFGMGAPDSDRRLGVGEPGLVAEALETGGRARMGGTAPDGLVAWLPDRVELEAPAPQPRLSWRDSSSVGMSAGIASWHSQEQGRSGLTELGSMRGAPVRSRKGWSGREAHLAHQGPGMTCFGHVVLGRLDPLHLAGHSTWTETGQKRDRNGTSRSPAARGMPRPVLPRCERAGAGRKRDENGTITGTETGREGEPDENGNVPRSDQPVTLHLAHPSRPSRCVPRQKFRNRTRTGTPEGAPGGSEASPTPWSTPWRGVS